MKHKHTRHRNDRFHRGLLLAPDDLAVGRFVAVHSLKGSDQALGCFGIAAKITAINMPFVVIQPVGSKEPATIDIRYLNLMPVSEEFVRAQTPAVEPPPNGQACPSIPF